MNIYHISDLHIHPTRSDYMTSKFDPVLYKDQCDWVKIWNDTITDDDIVIISGDTVWADKFGGSKPTLDIINKLNGKKKFIIKGNHDKWYNSATIRYHYNNIIPLDYSPYIIRNLMVVGSCGHTKVDKNKYNTGKNYLKLKLLLNNMSKLYEMSSYVKILVLHFKPDNEKIQDLIKKYNFNVVLYGHVHNCDDTELKYSKNGVKYYCSLAERHNYKPVKINSISLKHSLSCFKFNNNRL